MTFDYAFTTVGLNHDQILALLCLSNIRGHILVGNQKSEKEYEYKIETNNFTAVVYNTTNIGLSKNRNFLLKKSKADKICFLDNDVFFIEGSQETVEKIVLNSKCTCLRFNIVSNDKDRAPKQIHKNKKMSFKNLTSFGIIGVFLDRDFLVKNSLFFNENIGAGTQINHGEDTVFYKELLKKKGTVYQSKEVCFCMSVEDSTWHGSSRDLEKELFAHGYLYAILYPYCTHLISLAFVLTHRRCYPKGTKMLILYNYMKKGIRFAKTEVAK